MKIVPGTSDNTLIRVPKKGGYSDGFSISRTPLDLVGIIKITKFNTFNKSSALNVILGMIKAHHKIQVRSTAEKLEITSEKVKELIYELLGDNRIEGTFSDLDTFEITSDVTEAIRNLESLFTQWEKTASKKS